MIRENYQCNVLVTRPKHQAETLCKRVEQQGYNPIRFPTLEIVTIDNKLIKQQFKLLKQYKWLIFISANAVNFAIKANHGKTDSFKGNSIAAIGRATVKALHSAGLCVTLLPKTQFNSYGLLDTDEMKNITQQFCLIVRGQGGREILASSLRERGAKVDYLEVYGRKKPSYTGGVTVDFLQLQKIDVITMTSGEGLKNMLSMIDQKLHANLFLIPIVVISNRIKQLAEQAGFKRIMVTENPSNTAIINTILSFQNLIAEREG